MNPTEHEIVCNRVKQLCHIFVCLAMRLPLCVCRCKRFISTDPQQKCVKDEPLPPAVAQGSRTQKCLDLIACFFPFSRITETNPEFYRQQSLHATKHLSGGLTKAKNTCLPRSP